MYWLVITSMALYYFRSKKMIIFQPWTRNLVKLLIQLPCLFLLKPAEEEDKGFLILAARLIFEANSPITRSFCDIKVGSLCIPGEKDLPPAISGLFVLDLRVRGLRGLPGGALPGSFAIILNGYWVPRMCPLLKIQKKKDVVLSSNIFAFFPRPIFVYYKTWRNLFSNI